MQQRQRQLASIRSTIQGGEGFGSLKTLEVDRSHPRAFSTLGFQTRMARRSCSIHHTVPDVMVPSLKKRKKKMLWSQSFALLYGVYIGVGGSCFILSRAYFETGKKAKV